jgi:uncharacterized protein (TIGR02301 family)
MKFRTLATALCFAALTGTAAAQAPQQRQAPVGGEVWYAGQLVELANVLGGTHYLRILCEGRGDQRWRDYMQGVISREPAHRVALVEGFNRGYREQEARFPVCDSAATQMEAELRATGFRISDGLAARHVDDRGAREPAHN